MVPETAKKAPVTGLRYLIVLMASAEAKTTGLNVRPSLGCAAARTATVATARTIAVRDAKAGHVVRPQPLRQVSGPRKHQDLSRKTELAVTQVDSSAEDLRSEIVARQQDTAAQPSMLVWILSVGK